MCIRDRFVELYDFFCVLESAKYGASAETEFAIHLVIGLEIKEVPSRIARAATRGRLGEAKFAAAAQAIEHHHEQILAGAAEVEGIHVFEIRKSAYEWDVEAIVQGWVPGAPGRTMGRGHAVLPRQVFD